ncbi:hypothetical protein BC777_3129 [Yoonia maricola]|uniref:Uncharacterized protein n=1 Tax=Yoonia maricola TaxID=420999 RepID=A0A2M8W2H7_9RHOB|nr:hypothetical protein BC777_3129 [Yoonia maricola]
MKLLQIAFIAVLGSLCLATYATSKTLHAPCTEIELVQTFSLPAPYDISPERG